MEDDVSTYVGFLYAVEKEGKTKFMLLVTGC
jgi:hypothetical protein